MRLSSCSRVTGNCSITSSMLKPASRFSNKTFTGVRVPLGTHAGEVFKQNLHRRSGSPWHPRAADFSGDALHRGALRPIETHDPRSFTENTLLRYGAEA